MNIQLSFQDMGVEDIEYNIPDEPPPPRDDYCQYHLADDGSWVVNWKYRGHEFTQRFVDPDPVMKPGSARRKAAFACREVSLRYGIPITRPVRKNGREER